MVERTLTQLARHVVDSSRSLGVIVPPSSRLDQMARRVEPGLFIPATDPDFELVLESLRDLQQLGFIFDEFAHAQLPLDFRQRLTRVMKDTVLPQEDMQRSRGRDEQCELYVAAICAKAGLQPIFSEPDLRCTFEGSVRGIAVKRFKSYKNFSDRMKEAVRQVRESGLPGIVVADVSVALNPKNERIGELLSDEEFGKIAHLAIKTFVDQQYARLLDWTEGSWTQGILFVDHHVRQHPSLGWGLDTMTLSVNLCQHNQRRRREMDAFSAKFFTGLATGPTTIL